ncbi:MAG: DUF1573 domain-containing protein [Bacteroidota bacterium]
MARFFSFMVIFLTISTLVSAQSVFHNGNDNDAVITWEDDLIDLGKIKKDKPATVIYKFKNEGLKPLIITNVESSCGCTVPEYSKQPIKPLASGEIVATYDAKTTGVFSKSISVSTNASEKPKVLILKGEVIP